MVTSSWRLYPLFSENKYRSIVYANCRGYLDCFCFFRLLCSRVQVVLIIPFGDCGVVVLLNQHRRVLTKVSCSQSRHRWCGNGGSRFYQTFVVVLPVLLLIDCWKLERHGSSIDHGASSKQSWNILVDTGRLCKLAARFYQPWSSIIYPTLGSFTNAGGSIDYSASSGWS